MTDITELALRLKLEVHRAVSNFNPQMNIKTRDLKELVEAMEKAQDTITEMDNRIRKQNRHVCELFDDNTALRQRIAELESRTVTVKLPESFKLAKSSSGLTYYYADEVDAALSVAGIKVEDE